MTKLSGRPTYHHGDARNALLAAADGLLEQAGAAGLSLRQVADAAGLSRQAPYNHFADKEALLAELVRAGFERLGEAMADAGSAGGKAALERAAESYIAFAQGSPALFRLMFSCELVDQSRFPDVEATARASFGNLVAIIAAVAPSERVPDITLAAWSIVHGYATLCLETKLEPDARRRERAGLFTTIIMAAIHAAP